MVRGDASLHRIKIEEVETERVEMTRAMPMPFDETIQYDIRYSFKTFYMSQNPFMFMQLKDLGERKIIEILAKHFGIDKLDDCAAIPFNDSFFLITTDMVNEKTHFPEGTTPHHIGWFSVAVNLSDIAAKGGKPVGITLSIGIPGHENDHFIKEFARGATECAQRFNTPILGGDTKEMDSITVCGTAFGTITQQEFMPRYGMKVGDAVCVTGVLGRAGAVLSAIKKRNATLDELLLVIPRVREGRAMASLHVATSSMDISDGLASSLYQLSILNAIGFRIHMEKIPMGREREKEYALYSGGDYELLFTVPKEKVRVAKKRLQKIGCPLTEIGEVIEEKKVLLVENGKETVMENRGYEHFRDV